MTQPRDAEAHLQLEVLEPFQFEGNNRRVGTTVSAPANEALELLYAGSAKLRARQPRPPNEILEELEAKLSNLDDTIGPTCLTADILEKFEKGALADRRRCAFLSGMRLKWLEGKQALENEFREAFDHRELTLKSALSQVSDCIKEELDRVRRMGSDVGLTDQQMIERGVVCRKSRVYTIMYLSASQERIPRYVHYATGSDWASFYVRQKALSDLFYARLGECLQTGRILTVEETPSGANLYAPWQWDDQNPRKSSTLDSRYYVFSGNLPSRWFQTTQVLRKDERKCKVRQVTDYAEELYANRQPEERRLLKTEFFDLAKRALGAAESVAKDGWQAADIPEWKSGGAPKGNAPKCLVELGK